MSWRTGGASGDDEKKVEVTFDPRADALELMLRDDTYSDAVIRVTAKGKSIRDFNVNSMFMASASDIWKDAFFPEDKKDEAAATAGATEAEPLVYEMKDVIPSQVECIIRYAYFLEPGITVSNALPIRLLCEQYKITGLKAICDELLSEKSMTPHNVCEMLESAVKYDLDSLAKACVRSVEEKFKSSDLELVFASEGFARLSIPVLEYILKSDRLRVKEEKLWEHLVVWAATQAALAERALIMGGGDTPATMAAASELGLDDEPLVEDSKTLIKASSTAEASGGSGADSATADDEKKYDDGDAPVAFKSDKPLRSQQDFLRAVKHLIRFPVMDQKFLLTTVSSARVLSLEEEHAILKTQFLQAKHCEFIMDKRKGGWSFEDSTQYVRGTHGGSWSYSGPVDAVAITMSADCALIAIGLWCADGGTTASLHVYRGVNGAGQTPVKQFASQTFTVGRNTEAHPYVLEEPFECEKGQLYTLELHQRNTSGNSSYHTAGTRHTTITHDELTCTLSNAAHSPNSTTATGSGAFPCLWFCR